MTAENVRTSLPGGTRSRCRSERSTTRCQVVRDRFVLAFLIQPVLLFGRPGSLTRSHRTLHGAGAVADHGEHSPPFCDRAFALHPGLASRALSGLDIAVCPRTMTASSCVRATVGALPAGAGPAVHDAARTANTVAERKPMRRRGAHVRTPVADLSFEDGAPNR